MADLATSSAQIREGATTQATVAQTQDWDSRTSFLSTHHIGDLASCVGLVVAVYTLYVARGARKAAEAALARRDEVEIASLFLDLFHRFADVRSIVIQDDWSGLSDTIDRAVQVVNRVGVSSRVPTESEFAETSRIALRKMQSRTSQIKDSTKHKSMRHEFVGQLIEMLDVAEATHIRRLKNDIPE